MIEKKIFITGISGFIGFHLAKHLKARGDFVIGCDNFNDYYSPNLKKKRAKILTDLNITVIPADIRSERTLDPVIKKYAITHVVHLAAQAGVRFSFTHPHNYAQDNLVGFLSILEICRNHPKIKLIYASSSSVYGLSEKVPFSEKDPTPHPANLYAATKQANEMMAYSYHHLYGIAVTGLRYFTVYGPWGRPDMAYYLFSNAITDDRPIDVFNHGKMKRDFTYIDDVVEGTATAIDLGAACEIFNLGNNQMEELETLISLLEIGLGKKAIRNLLPMQKGEMLETHADITKAQSVLRYTPKTSLLEGIQLFTTWYKEQVLCKKLLD